MIGRLERGWLIVAGAGAFAIAIPAILLWRRAPIADRVTSNRVTGLRIVAAPTLSQALDRPLFSPTRSPVVEGVAPDATPAAQAPPSQPAPTLVGTIAGRAGALALVRTQQGETVRVRVGDDIDGWRVTKIGDRRVAFDQNGRREIATLEFRNDRQAGGDQPLPPPGPPASVGSGGLDGGDARTTGDQPLVRHDR